MTVLLGIAATASGQIDGMVLERGAIDCGQLDVPLFHRHSRAIGKVLTLQYRGDRLLVTAESDDAVALDERVAFMSPAVRALEHRNGRVTRGHLLEVSLVSDPANRECRIIERRQHDPLVALWRARLEQYDLIKRRVEWLKQYLAAIPAALAAAAPLPPPEAPARGSFSELAEQLNRRLE
jgi:hypothetical protein